MSAKLVKGVALHAEASADGVVLTVRFKSISLLRRLRPYLLRVGAGGWHDEKNVPPRLATGAFITLENPLRHGVAYVEIKFGDGALKVEIEPRKLHQEAKW